MVATGFESRPSAVGEGREGCDPAGAAGVTWCIQVDVCGVGRSSRRMEKPGLGMLSFSLWKLGSRR